MKLTLEPTCYTVCNGTEMSNIVVEFRGSTGWAILNRLTEETFNVNGMWESEPSPSNRTPQYLAENRYLNAEDAKAHLERWGQQHLGVRR